MSVEIERSGYVYILCNDRKNVLYIGCTHDLKKRIYAHRKRLIPGFTKKYNVYRLIYFESHLSIDAARAREAFLKGKSRRKKIDLIEANNSAWRDLSSEFLQ
jgi:putative endonuclease